MFFSVFTSLFSYTVQYLLVQQAPYYDSTLVVDFHFAKQKIEWSLNCTQFSAIPDWRGASLARRSARFSLRSSGAKLARDLGEPRQTNRWTGIRFFTRTGSVEFWWGWDSKNIPAHST